MTYYDAKNVNPAADLESAMDFQTGEMFMPPMDQDLDSMMEGMDIPFVDDDAFYDTLKPPMMCGDGYAPFVSSTASGFAQQFPHLEGGDKDKSVALYNHVCKTCRFLKDEKGKLYVHRSGFNAVLLGS